MKPFSPEADAAIANTKCSEPYKGFGVRHITQAWGDIYFGTREALIKAGIAKAGWFPDKPVPSTRRAGSIRRNFRIEVDGRDVQLKQYAPKTDRWEIRVHATDDERKRREASEPDRPMEHEIVGAVFNVGDRVTLYRPADGRHLDVAEVVDGYDLYTVDQGSACPVRRWGYVIQLRRPLEQIFCAAHELREYAHKPFHIRVAVDNGTNRVTDEV